VHCTKTPSITVVICASNVTAERRLDARAAKATMQ
jgi:hypothetical protein